jgi:hypothetical protein
MEDLQLGTADEQLMDELQKFYADPLGHVMFSYPWDTDTTIQQVPLPEKYRDRFNCEYGPDLWACEFLDDLGAAVRERGFNGRGAVEPIRFSTASGHGIGKTTLVAWVIKWIMDTRPHSKGMVTANTSDQLRTKTWAELGKWHALSITEHLFNFNSGRAAMTLSFKGYEARWRCDALTCREENKEAFQGLHAAGATPFYIFDEASGIPDPIFDARSGGATDGEPMWFDFGNPTRKSGYFFENTIGQYRHRYNTRHIDSRDVYLTNKDLMNEWIEDYGIDSDFVKVKVLGVFPAAGSTQFISTDLVEEAQNREDFAEDYAPLVIGVDVARFGDDNTVIYPRVGNDARSWGYRMYNGLDTWQVAEKVIEVLREFEILGKPCRGLFVDEGNMGAGVIDILRRLGYNPIAVAFQSRPADPNYQFKVDEMWGRLKDALPRLRLPVDGDLKAQLTQREYGYNSGNGKMRLESKKDMKSRLTGNQYASPDIADALALTYASEVADVRVNGVQLLQQKRTVNSDYDPLTMTF